MRSGCFAALLLSASLVTSKMVSDCSIEGTVAFVTSISQLKGCQESYFTITFSATNVIDSDNFRLVILDSGMQETIAILSDAILAGNTGTFHLATKSNLVKLDLTVTSCHGNYLIEYKEISRSETTTTLEYDSGDIVLDPFRPNSVATFHMVGEEPNLQMYQMTWNFPSSTFGHVLMDTGDGRIKLLAAPAARRFEIGARSGSTGPVTMTFVSFKARDEGEPEAKLAVFYDLRGSNSTASSSTMPPPTTDDPTTPGLIVYVKGVEEEYFFSENYDGLKVDLSLMLEASGHVRCQLDFHHPSSCRKPCHMDLSDTGSGCFSFLITIAPEARECDLTLETLGSLIDSDGILGRWTDKFGAWDVRLNDCLAAWIVQYGWIVITAVTFGAVIVVTLASRFVIRKLLRIT